MAARLVGAFALLPVELQLAIFQHLPSHALPLAACVCSAAAAMTDDLARQRCADMGIHAKASWCSGLSWRVQCAGRRFRRQQRVRPRQHITTEATQAHGTRRAAGARLFGQPAALVALSDGALAVCDAARRCVTVVELRPEGATFARSVSVDGIPCGICQLPSAPSECRVAVSVQGVSLAGDALEGVVDPTHRLVLLDLRRGVALPPWRNCGAGVLSFPNGICVVGGSSEEASDLVVATADWNNERVP